MRRGIFIYFLIIFMSVSFIGGSVFTTYTQFVEEGPLETRREVVIPAGASLKAVARLLHQEGVIASPSVFELGVRASGNAADIKAGEYSIPPRASSKMVMMILISGQTYIRRLVVPEGLTSTQIVALLDNAKGLVGTVEHTPRNGTLLPDTYHYSYGDTKEGMIVRMKNAMNRTINELWEKRADGLPFETPREAIVMASIVEKETSRAAERPHIASVFMNRLAKNMRLQSDPTVIYAITDGRLDLKRPVLYADLKVQHPYNTYVIYGLPDGPIANPGREAIAAVLNPLQTNDLYFVANGRGGHVFAPTYEEHLKNVQKFRQMRRAKKARAQKSVLKKTAPTATAAGGAVVKAAQPAVQPGQKATPTGAASLSKASETAAESVPAAVKEAPKPVANAPERTLRATARTKDAAAK